MARDPSDKPRWRGADASARSGPVRAWKPAETAGDGGVTRRRLLLAATVGGGVLVVGLIVALYLMLQPPRPACLVLLAPTDLSHANALDRPLNLAGYRGAKALKSDAEQSQADDEHASVKVAPAVWPPKEGFGANGFPALADPALARTLALRRESVLVVYVGLPGVVRPDGPAFVDPTGRDAKLADLLKLLAGDTLTDGKQKAALRGKTKLLILDCAAIDADWPGGQITNEFARALLEQAEDVRKVPNLAVLAAAQPGQRAWLVEDRGCTAFAAAVAEGLRGGAGGVVTPAKLAAFVTKELASWVGQNRKDAAQAPLLLPADGDDAPPEVRAVLDATVSVAPTNYQRSYAPRSFAMPAGLAQAWAGHAALAAQRPGPAGEQQRRWRRYRELLLRADALARAGEDAATDTLLGDVEASRAKLAAPSVALPGTSLTNSLPLADALGRPRGRPPEGLQKLADLPAAEFAAAWAEQAGKLGPHWPAFALDKADGDGPDDGRRAAELLRRADDGTGREPAEAHLLLALDAYQSETPPAAWSLSPRLRKLALTVRKQAEVAALSAQPGDALDGKPLPLYAAETLPWVRGQLAEADSLRRQGEDRLFSVITQAEAEQRLQEAQAKYDAVGQRAVQLRQAFDLRDRVCADLPYLTRWHEAGGDSPKPVGELWEAVHKWLPTLAPPSPETADVPALTKRVSDGYQTIRGRFDRAAADLIGSGTASQSLLADFERALATPLIDGKPRESLLIEYRKVAEGRQRDWEQGHTLPAPREAVTDAGRERSARGGELALAVLGQPLVDAARRPRDWKALTALAANADPDWWKGRAKLADDLRQHWLDIDSPAGDAANAVALARFGVDRTPEVAFNPLDAVRRRQWADLFAHQALRTALDHWADAGNTDRAYHKLAANRSLADAKTLADAAPRGTPIPPDVAVAERWRDAPAVQAGPAGEPRRVWTSEREQTFAWRVLNADAQPPDSAGTLWPVPPPPPLRVVQRDQLARRTKPLPESLVAVTLTTDVLDVSKPNLKLAVGGYYRGQRLAAETALALERQPSVVVHHYPPTGPARVAVVADDDLGLGALAIVLDCSGSMRNGKLDKARAVLKQVLRGLPRGTRVTIRVVGNGFSDGRPVGVRGESADSEGTPDRDLFTTNLPGSGTNRRVPRTVREQQPATAKVLGAGGGAEADEIEVELDKLVPLGATPMERGIVHACDLDLPADDGTKTVLILTDGQDTTFGERANTADELKTIRDSVIAAGRRAKAAVYMVIFQPDNSASDQLEFVNAEAQFRPALEALSPPGVFEKATSSKDLAERITLTLKPRFRLTRAPSNAAVDGFPPDGKLAQPTGIDYSQIDWDPAVAAGLYAGRVRAAAAKLPLIAGDRLALHARRDGTGGRFERRPLHALLPPTAIRAKAAASPGQGWLMLGLSNRYEVLPSIPDVRPGGSAAVVAALEYEGGTVARADDAAEAEIKVRRPAFAWFELAGSATRGTAHVEPRYYHPAPAWRVEQSGWEATGTATATLRAWVGDGQPEYEAVAKRDPARELASDFGDVTFAGKRATVTAAVEKHRLQASDRDAPDTECLVMRVVHERGRQVVGRVVGRQFDRREEQLYPEAGATTLIFGPWLPGSDERMPFTLELADLGPFKEKATALSVELGRPGLAEEPGRIHPP